MAASISQTFPPEEVDSLLAPARRRVEDALERVCSGALMQPLQELAPVVCYSVLAGGKRFRGVLLCAAHDAVAMGGERDASELAAAVEMVHAYSLVHDDLPCMDDDDMRRGRPSTHRLFSVPLATTAGIAMVPLAVRIALEASRELGLSEREGAAIVAELMKAAGAGGMIAGQLLDLEGEGRSLPLADLERIHAAKTGALIGASAAIGAMSARAEPHAVACLRRVGELLGLAFQITDDLLDVTASTATLGKTAGRDAELGKSTYPALLGLESARTMALAKAEEAVETLHSERLYTPLLGALASHVVGRRS